jgi:hypothetical protein
MEAAHNKAQARIDRIQIPAPKLYIESEFTDDEGREGGEFLALLWQRDLFHSARAMRRVDVAGWDVRFRPVLKVAAVIAIGRQPCGL